jgi:hypothetical protein
VTFVEPPEHFGLHLTGTSGRNVYIDRIDEESEADDFAGLRSGLLLKQIDGKSVEDMQLDAILALANDGKRPKQMLFRVHTVKQAKNKLKMAVKLGACRSSQMEKHSYRWLTVLACVPPSFVQEWWENLPRQQSQTTRLKCTQKRNRAPP